MRIEEKEVVDIVAAGGRVLALAFYGGDDHTATNLSEILRSFGIACDACAVRDAQLPFPGPEGATAMLVKGASEFLSPTERFFCQTAHRLP